MLVLSAAGMGFERMRQWSFAIRSVSINNTGEQQRSRRRARKLMTTAPRTGKGGRDRGERKKEGRCDGDGRKIQKRERRRSRKGEKCGWKVETRDEYRRLATGDWASAGGPAAGLAGSGGDLDWKGRQVGRRQETLGPKSGRKQDDWSMGRDGGRGVEMPLFFFREKQESKGERIESHGD